jgi:hypothetical protein
MLRLAADENFDGRIVRGLRRVVPDLDLIRVLFGGTPRRQPLHRTGRVGPELMVK